MARPRFNVQMVPRFLTILNGRNLPKIEQPRLPEPSTINEKTLADFTRVVEQTEILERDLARGRRAGKCAKGALTPAFSRDDPGGFDVE
jgi:hypothetical protein